MGSAFVVVLITVFSTLVSAVLTMAPVRVQLVCPGKGRQMKVSSLITDVALAGAVHSRQHTGNQCVVQQQR